MWRRSPRPVRARGRVRRPVPLPSVGNRIRSYIVSPLPFITARSVITLRWRTPGRSERWHCDDNCAQSLHFYMYYIYLSISGALGGVSDLTRSARSAVSVASARSHLRPRRAESRLDRALWSRFRGPVRAVNRAILPIRHTVASAWLTGLPPVAGPGLSSRIRLSGRTDGAFLGQSFLGSATRCQFETTARDRVLPRRSSGEVPVSISTPVSRARPRSADPSI